MTAAAGADDQDDGAPAASGAQRLDKWLWFARVVKSRTLAATLIAGGKIRVNKVKVDKPSHMVKTGDVITSTIKKSVRVLKVCAPGQRRGPASEAAKLYEDLSPPVPRATPAGQAIAAAQAGRPAGAGRPTKRDRRAIDRLQGHDEG